MSYCSSYLDFVCLNQTIHTQVAMGGGGLEYQIGGGGVK